MAGMNIRPRNSWGMNTAAPEPTPQEQQYNLYGQAVQQQAGDYDQLMNDFRDVYRQSMAAPRATAQTYNPTTAGYTASSDLTNSIANLRGLSQSGGYTDDALRDLRARGVSPIRSIYSSANRDIDRQRRLQGGYSPGYTANKTRMARDMSEQLGTAVQNVNAGIANNVASGRLSAGNSLASTTQGENARMNDIAQRNAGIQNEAAQFNISNPLQVAQANQGLNSQALQALQGQTSLYGTTPALASTFGNQALQGSQLQNSINQANTGNNIQLGVAGAQNMISRMRPRGTTYG